MIPGIWIFLITLINIIPISKTIESLNLLLSNKGSVSNEGPHKNWITTFLELILIVFITYGKSFIPFENFNRTYSLSFFPKSFLISLISSTQFCNFLYLVQ